jgi:hypothetical protein
MKQIKHQNNIKSVKKKHEYEETRKSKHEQYVISEWAQQVILNLF